MDFSSKYNFRYSQAMIDFLRENAWGKSNAELARMFSEKFEVEKNSVQISSVKKRYGIKSGLTGRYEVGGVPFNKGRKMSDTTYEKLKNSGTWFKTGNQSHNTMPIDSVVKDHKDGYWYHKFSMTGKTKRERWIPCHHEVWIKAHGPIPKDCVVIFLDGNKDNYTLENLALIKKSTNARLNQMHMRFKDSETTRTAIAHAQLKEAIWDIENRRRKRNSGVRKNRTGKVSRRDSAAGK